MTEFEQLLDKGFFISDIKVEDDHLIYAVSPVNKDLRPLQMVFKTSVNGDDNNNIGFFTLEKVEEHLTKQS